LKELNTCIDDYPSTTSVTMKEFGEGSRDIIAATAGWEINPRVLGVVPKSAAVEKLQRADGSSVWVSDAEYMATPKGISPEKLAVVLDIMAFMLKPEQQAMTYDNGYFYPGPAVKDVPLTLAPQASQDAIREFGRPEYAKMIADYPVEVPIFAATLIAAHRKWDAEIGATKK
jgi:putative spermidine/putrescine transport system substrate-binding protein